VIRALPPLFARHGPLALAVLVALAAWALQITWISWDHGPPESDEWHHLTKAHVVLQGWHRDGLGGMFAQLRYLRSAFPPLVHMAAVPFHLARGGEFTSDGAALSLGPWLVLLVLSSYGIGRKVGGPWLGLTVAVMVAGAPLVISLSRKFLLDLTLAALVASSLWALLRSDALRKPAWAWLSGLLFALALLAKFIAGIYLLGAYLVLAAPAFVSALRRWPLRVSAVTVAAGAVIGLSLHSTAGWVQAQTFRMPGVRHLPMDWLVDGQPPGLNLAWHLLLPASVALAVLAWRAEHDGLKRLLAVSGAALVACWLAGAWYLPHLAEVVYRVGGFSSAGGLGEGDPGPRTLAGWLYYPWALGRCMPRAWFHLLWIGLAAGLIHPRLRGKLAPILGSFLLAMVIINLSHNKEVRYTIALVPVIAVISLTWASLLPPLFRGLVWGTAASVALVLMTSWVAVHLGWWSPPHAVVWQQDRISSSGTTILTDHQFPAGVGARDVILTPDFYAVTPLPRDMPWDDRELPFGYIGP
jgi:4-amino-4-deoxy-L-arabinose transferase-like glycosyltransferase